MNGWRRLWVVLTAIGLMPAMAVILMAVTGEPYRDQNIVAALLNRDSRCTTITLVTPPPGSGLQPYLSLPGRVTAPLEREREGKRNLIQAAIDSGAYRDVKYDAECYDLHSLWNRTGHAILYLSEYEDHLSRTHLQNVIDTARISTIAWAVIAALVYALGSAIGWVWRGFFPDGKNG